RAGHVFVTESPDGPQLYIGSGDRMMGDAVAPPQDGALPVWVEVIDGAGMTLELHGAQGCLHQRAIDAASQRLVVPLPAGQTPYIRAQLVTQEQDGRVAHAISNPVYLRSQADLR